MRNAARAIHDGGEGAIDTSSFFSVNSIVETIWITFFTERTENENQENNAPGRTPGNDTHAFGLLAARGRWSWSLRRLQDERRGLYAAKSRYQGEGERQPVEVIRQGTVAHF
jgi:hypothetical protein